MKLEDGLLYLPSPVAGMLTEGDTAPDFLLPGTDGEAVEPYAMVEHVDRGPVVLAFYVFDFHPACTEEVCSIRDLSWFDLHPDASVLAVSTDSAFSHAAFAREYDIDFPLLSDSTGTVADAYGVRDSDVAGHGLVARRSVFVVDDEWTVRYAWGADEPTDRPDWDAVKDALDAL
jgi:peroxiredoxin